MQRASEQLEDGENNAALQMRTDPLLLLTYLRSTHLILAVGARLFDQQATRTVYEICVRSADSLLFHGLCVLRAI
jgi:hypothetical protein